MPKTYLCAVSGSFPRRVKRWHVARDGARFVVQQDLGWTRRIVFSVPHGSSEAVRVVRHSLLGSSGVEG